MRTGNMKTQIKYIYWCNECETVKVYKTQREHKCPKGHTLHKAGFMEEAL